ncbi:MAG: helix-turn-helix domain-containing protein, partial [Bacteroidota bacterium]
ALDVARERLPDCIVADVMMPRLDGLRLIAALRSDPATDFVPVVLLTARAGEEDKVGGLAASADDYLTKPFSARELRARVDNLIASRQRLRDRFGESQSAAPSDDPFLADAETAVIAALGDDTFGPDALAAALGQSRRTLSRRMSERAETTPSLFIRGVRLAHAARLLQDGTGTVTEVAYGVGFKSVSHFSRAFTERYGVAPSAYRREAE